MLNQLIYNNRREELLQDWRKAVKTGRVEEINIVCEHIRRFASDIKWDATIPEETKQQVESLLEIIEEFIKSKNTVNTSEFSFKYS